MCVNVPACHLLRGRFAAFHFASLAAAAAAMEAVLAAWDDDAFVALLGKLVGEVKHLQNGAAATPTEDRGAPPAARTEAQRPRGTHAAAARAAGRHVLEALKPHRRAPAAPAASAPLLRLR